VDVTPFLQGPAFPAPANERGWKDTIRTMPGEVTTILVRAGQIGDGSPYPFDPSAAPGYVWHCHVLEHEDNEMMRPYSVNR
ncbi:MAG: multicopper oxidase domain-containing protein, partial [Anaerolineae bacterium]|nr:multicopper oxidase domain-containing protein [Anaerolineae bacterium]